MHVDQKSVSSQTHRIPYTHIKTGGPRICFMFSGLGYTYEKPLLVLYNDADAKTRN
ncbi:hypothetical protein [Priestia megaterium]